jgi:uncharacterized protein (TIGR03067 family)
MAVSVTLMGFAPAPLPRNDRHREDASDVTGTWEFVLWEQNGRRNPNAERDLQLQLTREEFALVRVRGQRTRDAFPMCLEPTASPPAFIFTRDRSTAFVGSYRLRGKQMTMIFDVGARLDRRPTDFEGKTGYRFVLWRVSR